MKRIGTFIVALLMAATVFIPLSSDTSYGAVSVRKSMPSFSSSAGKTYYYTNNNVFYKYGYAPTLKKRGSTYVTGNCTWYAYARASEIAGKWMNSNFRWAASKWWSNNKKYGYYSYGSTPKVGAIACYKNHVAVVEQIVNGKVYVSESGWSTSSKKPSSASDLKFHYGTPWYSNPVGYIYVNGGSSSSSSSASKSSSTVVSTGTSVSYNVKISVSNLNMRTGPGTSYASKGYAKPGTYAVTKESNGWAKLSSNGYWVSLTYAKKTTSSTSSSSVSTSTSSSLYKVKVTALGLRMRSGPGTSYKVKGFTIKGMTYDIVDTKNGWGKMKSNGYWIKLSYTVPLNSEFNVKVTVKDLNMRTGPGITYKKKGYISPGTYTITKVDGSWGKLKSNGYWIKLSYTTMI